MKRSALVLINRRSGTVRSRGPDDVVNLVEGALRNVFQPLNVTLFDGDPLPHLEPAVRSKSHDVIIAGGGDGTLASFAQQVMDTTIVLGVLPLGTMNLVVQALGFSPQLETALQQFAATETVAIDVGLVNNRVFLHQVSFGLQPRMARVRERLGYRSRIGKMLSAARAITVLAMRPKQVRVDVDLDGEHLRISAPMLAITNNPIGSDKHWSVQHRLDGGTLGLYTLNHISLPALLRLARDYLRNRVHDNDAVENRIGRSIKIKRRPRTIAGKAITWKRRKSILASIDGEVVLLKNPVEIALKPKQLKVLAHKTT